MSRLSEEQAGHGPAGVRDLPMQTPPSKERTHDKGFLPYEE